MEATWTRSKSRAADTVKGEQVYLHGIFPYCSLIIQVFFMSSSGMLSYLRFGDSGSEIPRPGQHTMPQMDLTQLGRSSVALIMMISFFLFVLLITKYRYALKWRWLLPALLAVIAIASGVLLLQPHV